MKKKHNKPHNVVTLKKARRIELRPRNVLKFEVLAKHLKK